MFFLICLMFTLHTVVSSGRGKANRGRKVATGEEKGRRGWTEEGESAKEAD